MRNNKRRKGLAALLSVLALVGVFALAACGSSSSSSGSTANANSNGSDNSNAAAASATGNTATEDDKTITVAASSVPHAEILNNVVKGILADEGYDLQVTEFEDYVQPNTVVEDGQMDANYFQHVNYLNTFNQENGTHLVSVGYVHYEPFGIYAGKSNDLKNVPDGATVAVPDDTTNEARALLLLQQEGLIKLKDGVGVTATTNDIAENPHNLKIQEVEAAQVAHVLPDVDFGVINGNYALEAGLKVSDALATESSEGEAAKQYGNVLVVKDGNQNEPKIQALYKALTSDQVKQYINDTYQGAVVALF